MKRMRLGRFVLSLLISAPYSEAFFVPSRSLSSRKSFPRWAAEPDEGSEGNSKEELNLHDPSGTSDEDAKDLSRSEQLRTSNSTNNLQHPQFQFNKEYFDSLVDTIQDFTRLTRKRLAEWSLEDYRWRSSVFKSTEADRLLEESLARMRGEDPAYVRPMDASDDRIGPLGRFEKETVTWLGRVIEEEGRRAQQIVRTDGNLVRPMDASGSPGPLASIEKAFVDFWNRIRMSEQQRGAFVRPKDMDESIRGPLGDAEAKVYDALVEIRKAEMLRKQQSENRGGEVVRPIDIPGPLGEFEKAVVELVDAEQKRAKERERNAGNLVRPKDAAVKGPLGEAEMEMSKALAKLTEEERERLRNIQRVLQQNRPMEANRNSVLGLAEAIIVGILRGPQLLLSVVERVKELLQSEQLPSSDLEVLKEKGAPKATTLKMPPDSEGDFQ